jgi:pimeloyl-ACP methyl ester carboxylesterase
LRTWDDIVPSLGQFNILRLDLRGFGYSDKPDDLRYDAADQASIVAALAVELGLKNLVLIGHSYGGAVALLSYHRFVGIDNTLARGVVLINGAAFPLRFPFQVALYRYPLAQKLAAAATSPEWRVAFTMRRLFHSRARITPERIGRYSFFLDLPGSQQSFGRVARAIDSGDSKVITDGLAQVNVPCLVLWGEDDTIIPKSHALQFANALPQATVRLIPACGHAPQEEQPQATAAVLHSFLRSLS